MFIYLDLKKEALDDKSEKNHLSEPTPFEIVTKISAGQILRGYNIQRNIWSRVIPRKQLITIPNQIQLLAPRLGETFRCQEFFSEEKAMLHDHVVQHWGLNVTGSLGVFGRNITADLGFVNTFAGDTFQNEQSRGGYTEIKETFSVPTASFSLENVPHNISPEALCELIKLEKNLTTDEDENNKLCQDFLNAFGSHYFAGTYHFGGRITRSAICKSVQRMTKSESIKLSKLALQAHGEGIIRWFVFGGSLDVNNTQSGHSSSFKEGEKYKIEKRFAKFGGPVEADSIHQWKMGLVKCPSTWNIIDQDAYNIHEWKGVWELLKDEVSYKFKDIERIRTLLRTNGENML